MPPSTSQLVEVAADRQTVTLTSRSQAGDNKMTFSAEEAERVIGLLADARSAMHPARQLTAKPGEQISVTVHPPVQVMPNQQGPGPHAGVVVAIVHGPGHGWLGFGFSKEEWDAVDARMRKGFAAL